MSYLKEEPANLVLIREAVPSYNLLRRVHIEVTVVDEEVKQRLCEYISLLKTKTVG